MSVLQLVQQPWFENRAAQPLSARVAQHTAVKDGARAGVDVVAGHHWLDLRIPFDCVVWGPAEFAVKIEGGRVGGVEQVLPGELVAAVRVVDMPSLYCLALCKQGHCGRPNPPGPPQKARGGSPVAHVGSSQDVDSASSSGGSAEAELGAHAETSSIVSEPAA